MVVTWKIYRVQQNNYTSLLHELNEVNVSLGDE